VTLGELPQEARGSWSDYPLGVVRQLLPLQRGAALGLELFFTGDLPIGAGLSSSASLCVATALAAASSWGIVQRPSDRARIAWLAERDFVGVPCGPMDPYAIALAEPDSVLWFECARTTYAHLVLDPGALSIAVVDSGVRRTLAESAYRDRVAECDRAFATLRAHQPGARCLAEVEERTLQRAAQELDEVSYRRAEHVISEVARTYAARRAIEAGRFDELGALMFETHESLRTLYEVSCEELDLVVEAARATDGVHGARLTGAGFGGCAAVLLRPGMEAVVGERLGTRFRARYGREPRIEYFACGGGPREFAVA
jgi:galactokinase